MSEADISGGGGPGCVAAEGDAGEGGADDGVFARREEDGGEEIEQEGNVVRGTGCACVREPSQIWTEKR